MKGDKPGGGRARAARGRASFPAPWESQACGMHFPTAASRLPGRPHTVFWPKVDCYKTRVRQPETTRGCPAVSGLERMSFWKLLCTQEARDAVAGHM